MAVKGSVIVVGWMDSGTKPGTVCQNFIKDLKIEKKDLKKTIF